MSTHKIALIKRLSGGKEDFFYAYTPEMLYRPAQVNCVLHGADTVSLGGSVLTAHLFP